MSEQPLTMSVAEAARRLGVGQDWLARQARQGKVPHSRFGRKRRFTEAQLQAFITQQEQVAADPWIRSPRAQAARRRYG